MLKNKWLHWGLVASSLLTFSFTASSSANLCELLVDKSKNLSSLSIETLNSYKMQITKAESFDEIASLSGMSNEAYYGLVNERMVSQKKDQNDASMEVLTIIKLTQMLAIEYAIEMNGVTDENKWQQVLKNCVGG